MMRTVPVDDTDILASSPAADVEAPVEARARAWTWARVIAVASGVALLMGGGAITVAPDLLFDGYAASGARMDTMLRQGRASRFREDPSGTYAAIALVSQEDRRIYTRTQWGWSVPWDLRACGRALVRNLRAGGIREGCSTLAMQVAKLAMPTDRRRRSLITKLMQARLAWRSARESPDTIIGAYLSSLPCASPSAKGLRSCALLRFGRAAEALSPAEAMVLASAVQAPGRDLQPNEASIARARARLDRVLVAAVELGMIQEDQARAIRAQRIAPTAPSFDLVRASEAGWDLALTEDLNRAVAAARANALRKQGARSDPDLIVVGAVYDARGRLLARVGDQTWFERPVEAGSWVKPFAVEALMRAGVGADYLAGSVEVPLHLPLYDRNLRPWRPRNAGKQEDVARQPMAHVMRSLNTGTLAALMYAFVYLSPAQSRSILSEHLSKKESAKYDSATDRRLSLQLVSGFAGMPLRPEDVPGVPGYREITLGATRMVLATMKRHVPTLEVPNEDLAALLGVVRAPAQDLAAGLRTAWLNGDGSLTPLARLMSSYARQGTLRWMGSATPAVYKTATAKRNVGLTALMFDRCEGAARQVVLLALRPSGRPVTPVQGGTLGPGFAAMLSDCRTGTPDDAPD